MLNADNFLRNLLYLELFFLVASVNPVFPKYTTYTVVFFFSVVIFLTLAVSLFFSHKKIIMPSGGQYSIIYWLCFFIVLSWVIGVFVGVYNGVDWKYVFSNFFGLSLYVLLPLFFIIKPELNVLVKVIVFATIVQFIYGLIFVFDKFYLNSGVYFDDGLSLSTLRSSYSIGYLVGFSVMFSVLAYKVFGLKSIQTTLLDSTSKILLKSSTLLFISLFLVVVPAMSKGYLLVTVLIILFITLVIVYFAIIYSKISYGTVVFFLILIFSFSYILENYFDLILYTFSTSETSNNVRAEQAKYLINEFSFWGSGLGSSLDSGYKRDETGYGFELTYLNIVHKLGVFSSFLFITYLLTVFLGLKNIFHNRYVLESFFALGLMAFLVVGAGNPILLSPLAVFFHMLAIYFLLTCSRDYKNIKS